MFLQVENKEATAITTAKKTFEKWVFATTDILVARAGQLLTPACVARLKKMEMGNGGMASATEVHTASKSTQPDRESAPGRIENIFIEHSDGCCKKCLQ